MKSLIVLSFFVILFQTHAVLPGNHNFDLSPLKATVAPPLSEGAYDFEGIVKLSNCSGSLIRFKGQDLSAKGVVLTNGHCVGSWGRMPQPGEVIVNKADRRRMKIADSQMNFSRIRATRILYATMTNTDAALIEIQETYEELESRGVRALELSDIRPNLDTEIEVVSGYWERGYSCSLEEFIPTLKEASWTFKDSIRYSRPGCEVIGGTSGSPIIEKGKRVVIGVNNSGNESGKRCTMNNPCEVDLNGNVTVIKGASYGQQTYWFYSCLNEQFEIDLTLSSCQLPK